MPFAALRPVVGSGARGMIGAGFGLTPDDPGFAALREAFLLRYRERMTLLTRPFDAVPATIDHLQAAGISWGIVTNKVASLAEPLIAWLRFADGAGAIVCGDTTAHSKPHPEPLLEAARRLGVAPASCVYVGDDHRDVVAGKAAGMATLAAAWGYLGQGETIEAWGADAILAGPEELASWLETAGDA